VDNWENVISIDPVLLSISIYDLIVVNETDPEKLRYIFVESSPFSHFLL